MTFLYISQKKYRKNLFLYMKWLMVIIVLCTIYVAYPYLTLWSISKAIQTHDTKYLTKSLNWHSIQDHLKKYLTQDFHNPSKEDLDELPDFGTSFATEAVSNAIDHHINHNSLHVLLDYISPPTLSSSSSLKNKKNALQIYMSSHIYFSSPFTMHARIIIPGENMPPLSLTMKLQRWRWKITNISLPDQVIAQLFQQNK